MIFVVFCNVFNLIHQFSLMKKILFFSFLLISFSNFAQTEPQPTIEDLGKINVGLHGVEFSYEFPLSNKFLWENSLGVGMGSRVKMNKTYYTFILNNPTPYLKSELKYVYNTKKRLEKNKKVDLNSGNYIALQSKYSFGDKDYFDLNKTLLTEIHWGIQRPLGKKFTFNTHVGVGFLKDFETEYAEFSPTIGVKFGYKLF